MYQPWNALTRVYLSRALLYAVPSVGVVIFVPWMFAGLLGLTEDWSRTDQNPLGLYFNFTGVACGVLGLSGWAPLPDFLKGTQFRSLPLSTRSLAAFLCLAPACLILVTSLALLFGYRLVFGTDWPILTTSASMVTFSMLCLSIGQWLRDLRIHRAMLAVIMLSGWIVWFVSRFYPAGFDGPIVPWVTLSAVDITVLLLTAVAAFQLHQTAFRRIRCGDAQLHWLFQLTEADAPALQNRPAASAAQEYSSPEEALHAVGTEIGRRLAFWASAFFAPLAVMTALGVLAGGDSSRRGAVVFMIMFAEICSVLVGLGVTGAAIWSGKRMVMRQWVASLPFSDSDLSRMVLRSAMKSLSVVLGIVLSAMTLTILIWTAVTQTDSFVTSLIHHFQLPERGPLAGPVLIVFSVGLVWATMGIAAVIAAAGRMWIAACVYVALVVFPFSKLFLMQLGQPAADTIESAIVINVALLATLGTCLAIVAARRRHFIRPQTVAWCIAIVITGFIAGYYTESATTAEFGSFQDQLVICGAACLLALPVASLPLAISWNRHR